MTLGIEQGKIVGLHSGAKMDFGLMKAAFGPSGDRHSRNMTENVSMAYDDMFADAPETVNMAAGAADAGDDEDDVISLSSKASADPQVQEDWPQVHPGYVEQYGPWPGQAQDGWNVPCVMQLAPHIHRSKICNLHRPKILDVAQP